MSGIFRNIMTIVLALFSRSRLDYHAVVPCYFRITPFDCGIRVLKSDKYFQLAEAAQIDFLIKTQLINQIKTEGLSFVNASQLVKFIKPIHVFKRVRVESRILCVDEKFTYFSHTLFVGADQHAEVLVKMKFKKGAITVVPKDIFGHYSLESKHQIQTWNQALESM